MRFERLLLISGIYRIDAAIDFDGAKRGRRLVGSLSGSCAAPGQRNYEDAGHATLVVEPVPCQVVLPTSVVPSLLTSWRPALSNVWRSLVPAGRPCPAHQFRSCGSDLPPSANLPLKVTSQSPFRCRAAAKSSMFPTTMGLT